MRSGEECYVKALVIMINDKKLEIMEKEYTTKVVKCFIRFLKDKKAYASYIVNCHNRCKECRGRIHDYYRDNIFDFLIGTSKYTKSELINHAFDWSATPQGHVFWTKLNNDWKTICNAARWGRGEVMKEFKF